MTGAFRKRVTLAALASALVLAACQQQAAAPAAAPEGMPGVAVTNARVILPAVKGNPAAIYFDVVSDGTDTAVIKGADLIGAKKTELHETVKAVGKTYMDGLTPVVLKKGETLHFAPGGKHIMAFDVDPSLKPGGKAELTLLFLGGDKLTVAAELKAPGSEGAMGPMAAMYQGTKP